MKTHTEFGARLREIREEKGLRQKELARDLDVSASFLRRMERGGALPSLVTFAALWRLLGFDADALLALLSVNVQAATTRKRKAIVLASAEAGPFAAFGRGLAAARLQVRLTQAAVGRMVDCGQRHVGRMEGGHMLPSLGLFAQLRLVLKFEANELLTRLGESPPNEPFFAFGQIVAAARVELALSREEVARVVRCEVRHVREVEYGATLPTLPTLARLHKVLSFPGDKALQAVFRADEREAA